MDTFIAYSPLAIFLSVKNIDKINKNVNDSHKMKQTQFLVKFNYDAKFGI